MKRITIRLEPRSIILITFCIFIIIGLVTIFVVSNSLTRINHHLVNINQMQTNSLITVQNLNSHMAEAVQASFAYILSGNLAEKAEFLLWTEKLADEEDSYIRIADIHDPNEVQEHTLFNEITRLNRKLIDIALTMFIEYEKSGSVNRETSRKYENLIDRLTEAYNQLIAFERKEMEDNNANAAAIMKSTYQNTILTGMLVLLSMVTVCTYFLFYISYHRQIEEEMESLLGQEGNEEIYS